MLNTKPSLSSSDILVHHPGRVFETTDFGQRWVEGSYDDGVHVYDDDMAVNLALVEFSCVLPPFSSDAPGRYPVFGFASGKPCEPDLDSDPNRDPDVWCPPTGSSDVLLRVTYEPCKSLFHFGMNAGAWSRDLQWVSLGPALPEYYTGRVLRVSVLIAPSGLYPSIEDPVSEQDELFGELALSSSTRLPPWGESSTGNWWVTSGLENKHDKAEKSFPAGFGLSDVRVTLIDSSNDVSGTMLYTGGLDHLATYRWETVDPFSQDAWAEDFEDEVPISQMLLSLADQLHAMSGGASTWARRAEGLAEETKELALRLPEDMGTAEADEAYGE